MNQLLRSAKGITRSIHYEGKAKRVTYGCDQTIDPRIRVYANKDNNQAPDAENAKEGEAVKQVLEETVVKAYQGREAGTVFTNVSTPVETVPLKKAADASKAATEKDAELDKAPSNTEPKKEKRKAKKAKTAKAKVKDTEESKEVREAKAKPDLQPVEAAGGRADCEWCGEGRK